MIAPIFGMKKLWCFLVRQRGNYFISFLHQMTRDVDLSLFYDDRNLMDAMPIAPIVVLPKLMEQLKLKQQTTSKILVHPAETPL